MNQEFQKAIGYEVESSVIEIDRALVRRFVDAVGDPNPLWQDEAVATKDRFGETYAPPSLLCTMLALGGRLPIHDIEGLPTQRWLDGACEWEFFQPVRLGHVLTVQSRISDITEKSGRFGPMLLVHTETTWRNQHQEVIATASGTTILVIGEWRP